MKAVNRVLQHIKRCRVHADNLSIFNTPHTCSRCLTECSAAVISRTMYSVRLMCSRAEICSCNQSSQRHEVSQEISELLGIPGVLALMK